MDDPYNFDGVGGSAAATAGAGEDDPYNFDSAGPVASAPVRQRYKAAATAATMKQTIGTVGIVRRAEEASTAFAAEQAAAAAIEASPPPDDYSAEGFEAEGPSMAAAADEAGKSAPPPRAADGDEASLLRERLTEARRRTREFAARRADTLARTEAEQTERIETQRKVDSAYDQLEPLVEAKPGVQLARELEDDLDVLEAREHVVMLRQRLQSAKDVLRRHVETLTAGAAASICA